MTLQLRVLLQSYFCIFFLPFSRGEDRELIQRRKRNIDKNYSEMAEQQRNRDGNERFAFNKDVLNLNMFV